MKKHLLLLPLLQTFMICKANDGAFRANGNQLIPMVETDISVKKEILTIKRISTDKVEITVYYEFFNPKEEKELEVGFEAFSPSGDADKTPDDGQPYINHFTVTLNDAAIPYKVAIVRDSSYYRNGKYKTIGVAAARKEISESDEADFFYVYHFRARFKKGLNIIRHTYSIDLSTSIIENYSLNYVLTAAKRWANKQIDDFTLQLDMGEFQDFCIQNTFFKNAAEWSLTGTGKTFDLKAAPPAALSGTGRARAGGSGKGTEKETDTSEFIIRKGMLTFEKKNFKPAGEFYLQSFSPYYLYTRTDHSADTANDPHFNSRIDNLPFAIESQDHIWPASNDLSKKIERNLPFARRGYIFKSPELKAYFERQKWYLPDSSYAPMPGQLTKREQEWLKKE